jgi:hypothetical protein
MVDSIVENATDRHITSGAITDVPLSIDVPDAMSGASQAAWARAA